MLYGIPYMGSKTKIADRLLSIMPVGERFCDLFGGGFAMSHAALLSGRFKSVFYNELNPLLPRLISDAISGKYNYKVFKPHFVTREEFFAKKDSDGYIKYIWSFGNDGQTYMFSAEAEKIKRAAHDFVVFGKRSDILAKISPDLFCAVAAYDIRTRRMQLTGFCRKNKKRFDLDRLEQLERLERLQQLERLQRLEINCGNYLNFEYQDGDVVYCDPPYEGTAKYEKGGFDHSEFYNWVATREFPVWFSSYRISDNRFALVWGKSVKTTRGTNNGTNRGECLYANQKALEVMK